MENKQKDYVAVDDSGDAGLKAGSSGYFRKELNRSGRKVDNVRFVDSKVNMLIQLADIVVGSVNRSLQKDKTDNQTYIGLLKGKLELLEEFLIG